MSHLENKYLNLNYLNYKIDNQIIIGANANYDFEDSDKSLSIEHDPTCFSHLIKKNNCLKPEKNDNNEEIVDDINNIVNSNDTISKTIGVEFFDANIEKNNKCGRKRKGENYDDNNDNHNKFTDDNIRRKLKRIIFTHLLKYLNKQIKIKYNGKIGKGIFKKELCILNQSQITNTNVTFNKELLNKTLYDIFSDKISRRITKYPEDHNKFIIEGLINEEDTEKRIYFKNLFNITFSDCLEYLNGDKYFEQLNGLELFSEFKEIKQDYLKIYDDGEEYVKLLKYYLKEFKNIINRKNPRESKKRTKKKKI